MVTIGLAHLMVLACTTCTSVLAIFFLAISITVLTGSLLGVSRTKIRLFVLFCLFFCFFFLKRRYLQNLDILDFGDYFKILVILVLDTSIQREK